MVFYVSSLTRPMISVSTREFVTFEFSAFSFFALVLPKYEVKVYLPNVVSILEPEATVKICAK